MGDSELDLTFRERERGRVRRHQGYKLWSTRKRGWRRMKKKMQRKKTTGRKKKELWKRDEDEVLG